MRTNSVDPKVEHCIMGLDERRNRIANYLVFAALMISTLLGFQALWGVLFIFWTIPNFYSGQAFLLSSVSRREDPILFWLVQIAWVGLGVLMILMDFFPGLAG